MKIQHVTGAAACANRLAAEREWNDIPTVVNLMRVMPP
jgi:hypothetical protein